MMRLYWHTRHWLALTGVVEIKVTCIMLADLSLPELPSMLIASPFQDTGTLRYDMNLRRFAYACMCSTTLDIYPVSQDIG